MTANHHDDNNDALDIFIFELMADDELLQAFLSNPRRTVRRAADWGLPLSDSELRSLEPAAMRLWENLSEQIDVRFATAA